MKKEKSQEKILEFYSLNKKVKSMQEQLELLNQQLVELLVLEESINEIEKGKKEAFMPLGGGVFSDAEIKNKTLLMNVGSGVFVKKDLKQSKELIKDQQGEIKTVMKNLDEELQINAEELNVLQREIANKKQQ